MGVPPTCGFFSKWYLILGGIEAGQWLFVAALLFSSLASAVILARLVEIAYFGDGSLHDHGASGEAPARAEAPAAMLVPMVLAAAALVALGLYTGEIVSGIVNRAMPRGL